MSEEQKKRGPDLSAERALVGNVVRCIIRHDHDTYVLKNAFGKSLKEADMEAYIAFLSVTASNGQAPYPNEEAAFIVTTMLCSRYAGRRKISLQGIPYEELLRNAYKNGTETLKRNMESFIDSDMDAYGEFASKVAWLETLPEVRSVTPDFAAMLHDLRWWNAPEYWSKKKWARAMISNIKRTNV